MSIMFDKNAIIAAFEQDPQLVHDSLGELLSTVSTSYPEIKERFFPEEHLAADLTAKMVFWSCNIIESIESEERFLALIKQITDQLRQSGLTKQHLSMLHSALGKVIAKNLERGLSLVAFTEWRKLISFSVNAILPHLNAVYFNTIKTDIQASLDDSTQSYRGELKRILREEIQNFIRKEASMMIKEEFAKIKTPSYIEEIMKTKKSA